MAAAAADAERFYQDRAGPGRGAARAGRRKEGLPPLAISADGKGVAMRPGARRRRAKAPEKRSRNFRKRRGTGEKAGHKRMAETGVRLRRHPARTARPGPRSRSWPGPRRPPERARGR